MTYILVENIENMWKNEKERCIYYFQSCLYHMNIDASKHIKLIPIAGYR